MRTYQNWLRSEIRDRIAAIPAEQDDLQRARDAVPSDASLNEVPARAREMRALRIQNDLLDRIVALDNESIELEAELELRDKPDTELEEYGGPGRD